MFPAANGQERLPAGEGKETLENTCAECHGLDKILSKTHTRQAWRTIVAQMIRRGAAMSDTEASNLIEYLFEYFGEDAPAAGKVNVNQAAAKEIEAALELNSKDAAAIVRHREAKGNFKDWKDVAAVDGVDKSKIEARKDRLVF